MKKEFCIIEVKDDAAIKEWGAILSGPRHEEARDAIRGECVDTEIVGYFELEGKKYLAFFMDGEINTPDYTVPINKEHRDILRSVFVKKTQGEVLYDLRA